MTLAVAFNVNGEILIARPAHTVGHEHGSAAQYFPAVSVAVLVCQVTNTVQPEYHFGRNVLLRD